MLKIFKFIFLFSIIFVLSVFIFLNSFYQFGSPPNKEKLLSFKNSNNFDEGKFYNHYELPRVSLDKNNPEENESNLKNWFFPPKNKNPSSPLPSISFDKNELTLAKFSWLGHSTTLMNINDLIIMTDPVFNRASPIPIFGKPFAYENTTTIDDLPKISVVILSHDHYDHLDAKAIKAFSNNVDYFIVPLGVKEHLVHWGVESNKITELDWYESYNYQDINFTLTPAQHFSGRSFSDQNKTLWGSWVIKSEDLNIFFSGDSGYTEEFKKIGNDFGPFDLAFIECGGYHSTWADIHMFPYEVVQTSIDLKANLFVPISWAKFDLSLHNWNEPIIRVTKEAKTRNVNISTPQIGEVFNLSQPPNDNWW